MALFMWCFTLAGSLPLIVLPVRSLRSTAPRRRPPHEPGVVVIRPVALRLAAIAALDFGCASSVWRAGNLTLHEPSVF